MAQKYGADIMQYKVSDYVDLKTEDTHWPDVTFEHLLSMASGIGNVEPTRVSHYVETGGTTSERAIFRAATWRCVTILCNNAKYFCLWVLVS